MQLGDRVIEVDLLWHQDLFAAERQQLLRQRRGTRPGLLDFLEVGALPTVGDAIGEQQLRVAEDRGEQVVEIVRDAAGEAADAFDLLGLRKPLFEQPAVGDVTSDAQVAVVVHARPIAAFDHPHRPRVGSNAMLALRFAESHQLPPCVRERLGAVDEERVERLVDDRGRVDAEEDARGWIGLDDSALIVQDEHGVGRLDEHGSKLAFALEYGQLGFDARGDIDQEPAQLGQTSAIVELADHGFDDVDESAVRPPQPATMVFEPALSANPVDERFAFGRVAVYRAHADANGIGDRFEPEQPGECRVARNETAVGLGDVDAEQGAFEQVAVSLGDCDGARHHSLRKTCVQGPAEALRL